MASRRLLVLSFVRNYIDRWGQSPSYGEIANGCAISPTRARQLVKALVKTGHLLRTPGPRGLSLPTLRDDAVRQLRGLGWTVDERGSLAHAPCAETTLPGVPVLDYIPSEAVEEESGGKAEDA